MANSLIITCLIRNYGLEEPMFDIGGLLAVINGENTLIEKTIHPIVFATSTRKK